MCTSVQIVITECPPCGTEYVLVVLYDASNKKVFELGQRNEPLLQVPESEHEESSDQGEVAQPLPPVIHYDQYREPLLEYEDVQ